MQKKKDKAVKHRQGYYNIIYDTLFCSIFFLLSRESNGGAIFRTNPHPLRSCWFSSFPVDSMIFSQLLCYVFEATKQR